jgi:hypothetical protein
MQPPDYLATQFYISTLLILNSIREFEESIYKHPPLELYSFNNVLNWSWNKVSSIKTIPSSIV